MSDDSLSNESAAQSAINSAASFARNIITNGSSAPSSSANGVASSRQVTRQQRHAIRIVQTIAQTTNKKISALTHVNNKSKEKTQLLTDKYVKHTTTLIKNSFSQHDISGVIRNYECNLERFNDLIRIDSLSNLMSIKIKSSNLPSSEKKSAIEGVIGLINQTKMNVREAKDVQAVKNAFLGGVNAINGSLAKYISHNRDEIASRFNHIIDTARQRIGKKKDLSLSAKSLATQQINKISIRFRRDLASSNRVADIDKVKEQGITLINHLFADQSGILKTLTNFDNFVDQARNYVDEFKFLLPNERQAAIRLVGKIQNFVDDRLINSSGLAKISDLTNQREQNIAKIVITELVRDISSYLYNYYSNLNNARKGEILSKIKQRSLQVYQKIDQDAGSMIEIDLSKGIYALKSLTLRNIYFIHYRQLVKLTHIEHLQVQRMAYLPLIEREKIINEINQIFEKSVEGLKNNLDKLDFSHSYKYIQLAEKRFQDLVGKSELNNALSAITQVVRKGQQQISNSNLSPMQKQQAVNQINNDERHIKEHIHSDYRKHQSVDLDHDSGVYRITREIKNYLIDDRNNCFNKINHVSRMIGQIVKSINGSEIINQHYILQKLDQVTIWANHQINSLNSISKTDRIEQIAENKIYRELGRIIGQLNFEKAKAIRFIFKQLKSMTLQISLSNLERIQQRIIVNKADRLVNAGLLIIIRTRDISALKQSVSRIMKQIQSIFNDALQSDQRIDIKLINETVQSSHNRMSRIRVSRQAIHRNIQKISGIQLKAHRKVNNAKNLLLADHEEQKCKSLINQVVNEMVGHADHFKYSAHQKVNHFVTRILKQIKSNNNGSQFEEQRIIRQVTRLTNQIDQKINEDKDKDVDDDINHGILRIYQLIKSSSIREITRSAKRGYSRIQRMSALKFASKRRAIKAIRYIHQQTVNDIKNLKQYKLIHQLLVGGQKNILRVINQVADMDPIKYTAHNVMNSSVYNLTKQIRKNAHLSAKLKNQMENKISKISQDANVKISGSDDKMIDRIVNTNHARLDRIALKNAKSTGLYHLEHTLKRTKQQIGKMKRLTKEEAHQANQSIDHYYQQSIRSVNRATSAIKCMHIINEGEKQINNVLNTIVSNNSFKKAAHAAITHKVDQANQQINQFENLRSTDRKMSHKLLAEIKKQTLQGVDNANGIHAIYHAEYKGNVLLKRVIDKVSSANVIVAAVQSAHQRIVHSKLGREQKQSAIKQVNTMLNNGLQKADQSQNADDTQKTTQQSQNQQQRENNKSTRQQSMRNKVDEASNTTEPSSHHRVMKKPIGGPRYIYRNQQKPNHKKRLQQFKKTAKTNPAMKKSNDPIVQAGQSTGYRDGINGRDQHWDNSRSAAYVKAYQNGYRMGSLKYRTAYRSGSKAGRAQGMIAKPMVDLKGLSKGYVDGYRHAYRRYKVTLPIRIYARKPIYVHSSAYFNPENRIRKYRRHHFKIVKIVRRSDGSLCYQIENGGYITADSNVVTRVNSDSVPRTVKVINPRGIYVHKEKHFDAGNALRLLSKGTRVKVTNAVYDGDRIRYQLRNGTYITGDRGQVKKAWL